MNHPHTRLATTTLTLALLLPLVGCAELLGALELESPADSATAADGLREALRVGTGRTVDALGQTDGYLGNPLVRIPMPDKLSKIEKALRTIGADRIVNDFVTSMNRAAEAAAPEARQVFVQSIKQMRFEDAMTILRGDSHEATDFFRTHAGPRLRDLFEPIVSRQLDSVGATREFNEVMDRANSLPFLSRPAFELEAYVTDAALDGLFDTLAREEERIRTDPRARTTELLRRFFGDDG